MLDSGSSRELSIPSLRVPRHPRRPGADSGGEGKSIRAEKYGTQKSNERREESLGTMSYQTSSKRSPPFCPLIGQKNTKVFWHQSEVSSFTRDLRNLA